MLCIMMVDFNITCEIDDLVGLFPRRSEIGKNYELWLYPHIDLNTGINNSDDLVFISKKDVDKFIIYVYSEKSENLDDKHHLGKIINLVHDISTDFEVSLELVEDIYSDELAEKLTMMKRE